MFHLANFNYNNVPRAQTVHLKNAQTMQLDENVAISAVGFNELLLSVKNYYSVKDAAAANKKVK